MSRRTRRRRPRHISSTRRRPGAAAGRCPHCGYDLRDVPVHITDALSPDDSFWTARLARRRICPECGRAITYAKQRRAERTHRRREATRALVRRHARHALAFFIALLIVGTIAAVWIMQVA